MTKLSEMLGDLSVGVGDIEARAEAFIAEQQERRDAKVAELRSEVHSRQDQLQSKFQDASDEISSAWSEFNRSMKARSQKVQAVIEAKKDVVDAQFAASRADRLERNALFTLDFAIVAMEDAELAVAEALDARLHADELASKGRLDADNARK